MGLRIEELRGAGAKAIGLRRNLILPNLYIGELVSALSVGLRSHLGLSLLIDQRNSCAGDDCARTIAHITENRGGLELCMD